MTVSATGSVTAFIQRWQSAAAAERANYQLFLTELCELLDLPRPEPRVADESQNTYTFEHPVAINESDGTQTIGYIDLYRRGCFVLETKQGITSPYAGTGTPGDSIRAEAGAPTQARDTAQNTDACLSPPSAAPISAHYTAQAKKKRTGHGVRGTVTWDTALQKAKAQAERYARNLPPEERPPFLVVVDVGHCIDLYAEFSRTGGTYQLFPDNRGFRILLKDLEKPEIRERLRKLWLDPIDLDPSRRAAKVTREIADSLAKLAKSLEQSHTAKGVAEFLMRCLFTMFAEDVKLLPKDAFKKLLQQVKDAPEKFQPAVEALWRVMNTGGFHAGFMENILRFNGGLFATPSALPLNRDQIQFLVEAAEKDWRDVEPAIFGTLLERALDPRERHKLGAHYTPRAYVERLVIPTVVEPLREEWQNVQAAAFTLAAQGKEKDATKEIHAFHRRLCNVRVLDPACGSGNFLYVALEHLKRLEGEIFNALHDLGESQTLIEAEGFTVDPHQFLGIEINPRAAVIAELVLWIGYLQWHYRTHGDINPPEPVIKNFKNIENRDAVLEYDRTEVVIDPDTHKPVTRWDGRTMKKHPVTGEDVPDETARVVVERYVNPRPAKWPEADFVVGNPPFIGTARMRDALGDGYTEAIRKTIREVPESSDYVMYWWNHAAHLLRKEKIRRFGFITTNSIRQTFNRRVLEYHMNAKDPVSLVFAIPDHPWVDSADGAAVRIAMTVGLRNSAIGIVGKIIEEKPGSGEERSIFLDYLDGVVLSDLRLGANIAATKGLMSNVGLSCMGVKLHGSGFLIDRETLRTKLGIDPDSRPDAVKKFVRGRDLAANTRECYVLDFWNLKPQQVEASFPDAYQWLLERVKPERDQNNRDSYKEKWWIFGEPRKEFRPALLTLPRFTVTVRTAKHRIFQFLDSDTLFESEVVAIALSDPYFLGVLASSPHLTWSLAQGGTLEDRPRYNNSRCFETFPFPGATEAQKARIRELGERLDAHRKARQAAHPGLTMTGMYNVLEKLRRIEKAQSLDSGLRRTDEGEETLTAKEREIHEQGLVSVLKEIHDALDAAVVEAYGWPADLNDEEILERLVALNAERAAEEKRGIIRWLRPEFQAKGEADRGQGIVDRGEQGEIAGTEATDPDDADSDAAGKSATKRGKARAAKTAWPKSLADQAQAVRAALAAANTPLTPEELARTFKGAKTERVTELLQTLAALGQCRETSAGRYAG